MMKQTIRRFGVILGFFTFLIPSIALSAQENRIALVIGNGAYKSSPLANPVNDANDMATALKKCDFTVMKSINASRKEMRRAIRKFGEEINKGAVGLFYYAGHGIQVDGENYLVPVGSSVYSEDEVDDECLKVSSVLRKMESAGNRLNIIILDACRDNPFGRSFRSSNMGLAKMDAPTGSILAYATAPGSIAADGTGGNGLYTSKMLIHMNTPGLKIEEVFKRVRIDVVKASGKRQTPWESSSLMGDFYFNIKRGIVVEKRPVVEPDKSTKETPEYASVNPDTTKPKIFSKKRSYLLVGNTDQIKEKKIGLSHKNSYWYEYVRQKGGKALLAPWQELYSLIKARIIDAAIYHPDQVDHLGLRKVAKKITPVNTPYKNITFLIGNITNLKGTIFVRRNSIWKDLVIRAGGTVYTNKIAFSKFQDYLDLGVFDGFITTFEGKDYWSKKLSNVVVTPLE